MKNLLWILLIAVACPALAKTVTIELKHDSETERETREQLRHLLASYDLSRYTFTHAVMIEDKVIPHSHPVLTLNTRYIGEDDKLLSTYVHEQLHWYLVAHKRETDAAKADLRKLYPKVPVGYPDGAMDEESTYLHLVDCYLELQADRQLMGPKRAAGQMEYLTGDHYRWVYKTIVDDEQTIGAVVAKHHLLIK
jgi:hypothetical protein